jgi:hypothetical protein
MSEVLEWAAFGIGTIGTVMWALGLKWNGKPIEGWFWLASALIWIVFAMVNDHNGLAARDLIGTVLYVVGIWKSFFHRPVTPASLNPSSPDPACVLCGGTGVHQLAGPGTSRCPCKR